MTRRMCARVPCLPCRACHTVLLLSFCTFLALVESRSGSDPALVAGFNASGLPLLPGAAGWPQMSARKLRFATPIQYDLSPEYYKDRSSSAGSNMSWLNHNSSTELNSTASGAYATNNCSLC